MRYGIAQVALATTCLLAGRALVHAQSAGSTAAPVICPALPGSDDQHPSGPKISIAAVTFSGSLRLPISDQHQIATSIQQRVSGYSLDEVRDEVLKRVKAGWQDRGYFLVNVSGKVRTMTSSLATQLIAITAHVDEGDRYRLGKITFKNNKAIADVAVLRSMIPMKDGDIFSREKMVKGIENLRNAYGEAGYINSTGVPDTKIDDEKKIINVDFDIDEGKQFYVSSINIIGLDDQTQRAILKDFPVGRVYNTKLFGLFVEKYFSVFKLHHDDPRLTERHLDERTGTVAITLYACPCPIC